MNTEVALSFACWAALGATIALLWFLFCRERGELADEWQIAAAERTDIADAYRELGRNFTWLFQSVDAIKRAERFIAGFEDDATQEGVRQLLVDLRAVLEAKPEGAKS